MRPHTERLVNQFPTVAAGLSGEARIDSDHSMSSILSFGFKDIEERAPGGVQDGFGQMMIFHHRINIEVLNGNLLILLAVRFGHFEASRQIVLQQERALLFIVLLGGSQHLVIEMTRLDEAGHEPAGLFLVWIQAVFKRSHDLHCTADEFHCPAGKDAPVPLPPS